MIEISNCSKSLPAGSCFITRYKTPSLPAFISLYLYTVVSKVDAKAESSVMGRIGAGLTRKNDIPVVRFRGRTLVAPTPLSTLDSEVKGAVVEPSGTIRINTLGADEKKAILRLAILSVKNAAATASFVTGISNYVLSPRFRLEDENKLAGLQTGIVFQVAIDESNALILDCDMKSKILSQVPLSEVLKNDPQMKVEGLTVSSLQSVESLTIEKVKDYTVSKKLKDLGESIYAYNERMGNYAALEKVNKKAPVVSCRVGDAKKAYDYDSQLLFQSLDFHTIKKMDRDFEKQVSQYTKMDISERESFLSFFMRKIRVDSMPQWLTFSPEPEFAGKDNNYQAHTVSLPEDNLLFGGNGKSAQVEDGISRFGVRQLNQPVKIGLLYPEDDADNDYQKFAQKLVSDIEDIARCKKGTLTIVTQEPYNSKNPFKIRNAVESFSSSDCDIAVTVLPPRGTSSPYVMLKAELSRRRLASQMVHFDGDMSSRQLVNILVGITSKVGTGVNWELGKLLYAPDLFIGLSSAAAFDGKQAVVATAFDAKGKALDVTVEVFEPKDGKTDVISQARLLHLVEGSLYGYRREVGAMPRSVVVHRDGEFVESQYQGVWEHFDELGVQCTLVEVDYGLPPRLGTVVGGEKRSPEPGTVMNVSDAEGYLISTSAFGGGSPRPVGFRRIGGTMDLVSIGHQLFWLSRAHMGSVVPSRLPVTIHFARRVLTMVKEGTVLPGTMGPRMLFV